MSMPRALVVGIALLVSTSLTHAFDITDCNQAVPAGEIGVLQADYRDLVSARPVRLRNSTCGTSGKIVYDSLADTTVIRGTWGVCTDD